MEEKKLDVDISSILVVNELDIETELSYCASHYYRFASLADEAELIAQKCKLDLEVFEVQLAKDIRKQLLEDGYKADKITESEVKREFRSNKLWLALKNKAIDAECDHKKLEKAAKGFDIKSQNCMSLNKRQLYKASKGMIRQEDL